MITSDGCWVWGERFPLASGVAPGAAAVARAVALRPERVLVKVLKAWDADMPCEGEGSWGSRCRAVVSRERKSREKEAHASRSRRVKP